MTWDASGRLLTQTGGNGDSTAYSYDSVGRPTQSAIRTASGTAVTSMRYADATSLLPLTIASPGWMRSYVYDGNGNVIGTSELTTNDPTGEKGFEASTAGGQIRTYGMTYDPTYRLQFAQLYENGARTGEWSFTGDATGNLRDIGNRMSDAFVTIINRDKAHRPVGILGPGF